MPIKKKQLPRPHRAKQKRMQRIAEKATKVVKIMKAATADNMKVMKAMKTSQTIGVDAVASESMSQVKTKIQDKCDIPPNQARLYVIRGGASILYGPLSLYSHKFLCSLGPFLYKNKRHHFGSL